MKSSGKSIGVSKKLWLLFAVGLIGFALLIYYQQETFKETWETLLDAKLGYVLLLPVLQAINYFFIGNYYQKMFAQFGTKITQVRSWGVVAAMNFVNQVLPSGGLSGITYLAYGFHASIKTGKTTLIQVGRYMFAFGAYALLLPFAVALVIQNGRLDDLTNVTEKAASNSSAIITLGVFVALMGFVVVSFLNKRLSNAVGHAMLGFVNFVSKTVFRKRGNYRFEFIRKLNAEFHEGVEFVKQQGPSAVRPGFFMLLSAIMEVSIVYCAVLAVGGGVGLGPVFLAFVAANIVGVVSIIPGDVGVHEATIIIVLAAFGVDEPVAISATLLYRVFNKAIFLPIGFFFYTRILKPALEADAKQQAKEA